MRGTPLCELLEQLHRAARLARPRLHDTHGLDVASRCHSRRRD
ncbi:hypothetical protein [Mumia zhuanghuii]|nr:hypothetical protein [Mumia zhuanghuii]